MSLELKDVTNVKKFESQHFGAYVQTNDNGTKTLYVNDNNLSTQALIYTEGNTAFLKKN
jgi:hypothetical protein